MIDVHSVQLVQPLGPMYDHDRRCRRLLLTTVLDGTSRQRTMLASISYCGIIYFSQLLVTPQLPWLKPANSLLVAELSSLKPIASKQTPRRFSDLSGQISLASDLWQYASTLVATRRELIFLSLSIFETLITFLFFVFLTNHKYVCVMIFPFYGFFSTTSKANVHEENRAISIFSLSLILRAESVLLIIMIPWLNCSVFDQGLRVI